MKLASTIGFQFGTHNIANGFCVNRSRAAASSERALAALTDSIDAVDFSRKFAFHEVPTSTDRREN
jgi:hypothetical protein